MTPKEVKATNDRSKSIVEAIRDFIKECPYLPEFHRGLNVDFQGGEVGSYMIESSPGNPYVKRYANGTGIKQFPFLFSSKEMRTEDVKENISNAEFYERFSDWLDECTMQKVFPKLDGRRSPIKIFATTSGYVYDTDNGTAQYVIQCNFHYYQF